ARRGLAEKQAMPFSPLFVVLGHLRPIVVGRQAQNIGQAIETILFLLHYFDLVDFLFGIAGSIEADELTQEWLAGPTTGSGFAPLADGANRRTWSFANHRDELAFGNSVAITNLCVVGQCR